MFRVKILLMAAVLVAVTAVAAFPNKSREARTGQENSEQIEQSVKLVTDEAILDRVNSIGQKLAEVAKTCEVQAGYGTSDLADFTYTFKVIEDNDINAMSLPGGYIYVNSGLLDFVKSDDELAGVLAHEIAHCAHHHVAVLTQKQSKWTQ